jgi:hypothetical protein
MNGVSEKSKTRTAGLDDSGIRGASPCRKGRDPVSSLPPLIRTPPGFTAYIRNGGVGNPETLRTMRIGAEIRYTPSRSAIATGLVFLDSWYWVALFIASSIPARGPLRLPTCVVRPDASLLPCTATYSVRPLPLVPCNKRKTMANDFMQWRVLRVMVYQPSATLLGSNLHGDACGCRKRIR